MIQCVGCYASFTLNGYFQHVARTQNTRCQMTHMGSQSQVASLSIHGIMPPGLCSSSMPANEGESMTLQVCTSVSLINLFQMILASILMMKLT